MPERERQMIQQEKIRILVADDEEEIRETLREIFSEDGYDVVVASEESTALDAAGSGVDLAIVDIKLGVDNGIDLLRKLKQMYPYMPVIMITGFGTVALTKEAFKIGAHDFLEKPLRLIQVRTSVRNALEGILLRKQLRKNAGGFSSKPVIVSDALKKVYQQASRLAQVKEPVVITGPSGAGKDLVARFLHFEGVRAQGPFLVTNAASLPPTLAEDELFGHERGAFTGADRMREGCFEQANGGTLFLDEIGDMDLNIQAKLLRVLETGEFQRLGGSSRIHVDVRLICATHKNLEEMVDCGKFRKDLWYRISAFVLRVPGLDRRKEDIAPLAEHFLRLMCSDLGIEKRFSPAALNRLGEMTFPGNVRELKHLVARLAVYTDKPEIDICDIPDNQACCTAQVRADVPVKGDEIIDFRMAKMNFEREYLLRALKVNGGNITATARAIGMAQSNLSRKLKELGIGNERENGSEN